MEHTDFGDLAALFVPDTVFTAPREAQAASQEVVIYSRTAGQVVTIALPTYNGLLIVPKGLKAWNRKHGLIWECFCGLTSDKLRSCQIVVASLTDEVLAFCHYEQNKCGFFINLTKKYLTAQLRSDYSHLPSIKSNASPAMGLLLATFKAHQYPPAMIAPYFEGYCGEHVSMHPGCIQLDSLSGYKKDSIMPKKIIIQRPGDIYSTVPYPPRRIYSPPSNKRYFEIDEPEPEKNARQKTYRAPVNPIYEFNLQPTYGPKTLDHLRSKEGNLQALSRVSDNLHHIAEAGSSKGKEKAVEQDLTESYLARLQAGDGLEEAEYLGFLEKCNLCGRHFLGKFLRVHIPGCAKGQ